MTQFTPRDKDKSSEGLIRPKFPHGNENTYSASLLLYGTQSVFVFTHVQLCACESVKERPPDIQTHEENMDGLANVATECAMCVRGAVHVYQL